MQTLLSPHDRLRAANRWRPLAVVMTVAGIVFTLVIVVALLVGAGPEGESDGSSVGVWGPALLLLLAWWFLVYGLWRRTRQRHERWAGAASAPAARVPATVLRRRPQKTGAFLDLRLPDGEEWAVLYEKGGLSWVVDRDDAVLVEIWPSAGGGCVGAFQVQRTGQVCPFSAEQLPRRVATA